MQTLEYEFENETNDEARQHEQRNEKRPVDRENECRVIEPEGPTMDRIPWDEADMKVESYIYHSERKPAVHSTREVHTQKLTCTQPMKYFTKSHSPSHAQEISQLTGSRYFLKHNNNRTKT